MNLIEALADCIMRFEGWIPPSPSFPRGSTSWRNRNPGNLRPLNEQQIHDDKGYRVFISLEFGWLELCRDIDIKITGQSEHNKLTPDNTLHDFFNIYAPALDHNDPQQYSRQIADWLNKIFNIAITPDIKLKDLIALVDHLNRTS